jgi:hypothetical protein
MKFLILMAVCLCALAATEPIDVRYFWSSNYSGPLPQYLYTDAQQKDFFWVAAKVEDAAIRAVEITVEYLDSDGHELTLTRLAQRPETGVWATEIFTFKRGAVLRVTRVRVSTLQVQATRALTL